VLPQCLSCIVDVDVDVVVDLDGDGDGEHGRALTMAGPVSAMEPRGRLAEHQREEAMSVPVQVAVDVKATTTSTSTTTRLGSDWVEVLRTWG
jgi:hypothetical protein